MSNETDYQKDLKWIKKHFGERMSHFCRSHFATLLETPRLLPRILDEHFEHSNTLLEDIKKSECCGEEGFIQYILSLGTVHQDKLKTSKSAIELFKDAGYTLYPECKDEDELQAWRKYYAPGEELCSFDGGRLETCRVWFATRNPEEKRRERPSRQDPYGTSVISVQVSRNGGYLSIKNRYNHSVTNPDATFNNNLENICPGLTYAFERDFDVNLKPQIANMPEIEHYVMSRDKYYKFNYNIGETYYGVTNKIITWKIVMTLPPHQMLVDYYAFDFQEKCIMDFRDEIVYDVDDLTYKDGIIFIKRNEVDVCIGINKEHQIKEISSDNMTVGYDQFCYRMPYLERVSLPNLKICGSYCFSNCNNLKELNLPALLECEDGCFRGGKIEKLSLPSLTTTGDKCLAVHKSTKLDLPELRECGDSCLRELTLSDDLFLPKLEVVGNNCFSGIDFKKCELPSLTHCGDMCFLYSSSLTRLNLPNLNSCGKDCFRCLYPLKRVNVPQLQLEKGQEVFNMCPKLKQLVISNKDNLPENLQEVASSPSITSKTDAMDDATV